MSNDLISDDDKKLFRQTVGKVTPLPGNKKISQVSSKPPPEKKPRTAKQTVPQAPALPLSDYIIDSVTGETILSWFSQPLPSKRLREFRQGLIPFADRLDLHGLSGEQAREKFLSFIQKSYDNGYRCILLIHGKGGQHNHAPRIKNLINRWLPQHPYVQGYHSAIARHGGTGAVYVLLKKSQNSL